MESFRPTSSLIRRLRTIALVIACFTVLDLVGVYFFNRAWLATLSRLREGNALVEATNRLNDGIRDLERLTDRLCSNRTRPSPNSTRSKRRPVPKGV